MITFCRTRIMLVLIEDWKMTINMNCKETSISLDATEEVVVMLLTLLPLALELELELLFALLLSLEGRL